ncbi:MAG: 4-hydroxybenzoate octaprenyltransferase [Gammaproteobacteria bacterium]|nr:MAG: 4-hydroxybenzoate octaprenyltransferase [Gammaproteobacteria bacterium]
MAISTSDRSRGIGAELSRQLLGYARLMRLDRPIGTWLLLWPTLWALWIAGEGRPDPQILLVFVAGTFVMRSAGCVINDFADRRFDGQVARTRDRPLATGEVAPVEALMLFAALGLIAIALLLTLNELTRWLAVIGAALTIVYPFTKRFFVAPQLLMGAAFGWGIPMAFAAETGSVPRLAWLMWLTVVVWAVMYDTLYAMADREDDARIGVRSTAILFGRADLFILSLLQLTLLLALLLVGQVASLGRWYYAGVAVAAALLLYQRLLIRDREPAHCFQAFLNNRHVGAAIAVGIFLDYLYRG